MAKATEYQFSLPLRTDAELKLFVEKAFGVRIPDKQICPDHSTPWQAFADAYFARSRVSVWKASRGFGGKSYLLALLGLVEAITLKADVNILGGSGEQSSNVLKYVSEHWDHPNAPLYILEGEVRRETRLCWGNKIKALLASSTSVRGPHVPRLRLDEIDEMDITILDAALGQTMSTTDDDGKIVIPAQTVLSSTHQYAQGAMTEILKRAAARGWPVFHWCLLETVQPHGWLPVSEVEAKKSVVTSEMWRVEYELQEPSPESRAILPSAVAVTFKPNLGEYAGANGEYIEIEAPQVYCHICGEWFDQDKLISNDVGKPTCPTCGKMDLEYAGYATGADWARKKDWTVIVTLRSDVEPMRVVAFERCGRMPWPVMVEKYNTRLGRYTGRGGHDATGLGDVVDDYIEYEATGYLLVGRRRSNLLSEYIASLERGEIESPDIEFMHAEHRFASVDDVYGSGHLPDSVCAMAIAREEAEDKIYFA